MKLLVLSNGHGEDVIAVRIIEQLQKIIKDIEISALPIVGQGYIYNKSNIPLAGRVQQMPSGGFIYKGGNPLWSDIHGGLIQLTIEQLKLVRQWGKKNRAILAVGDIVPLLYAWSSRANYAFIGTAKSDYYLRDETDWLNQTSFFERKMGSVYLPWERWLMSRRACKAVFPRDTLTSKILNNLSVPAYDLGNPMMDKIITTVKPFESTKLNVLLLAGSRMPEAINNWQQILASLAGVIQVIPAAQLQFLGAIAPALNIRVFVEDAAIQGWQIVIEEPNIITLSKNNCTLLLSQKSYPEFLHQANIAIAMAGTATEQFVGLGKPAVIMPGSGPQFTYAFAEAQSRLLGCSIVMVENPEQTGDAIAQVIKSPERLLQIAVNGKRRMGEPGAAERIALCLKQQLLS